MERLVLCQETSNGLSLSYDNIHWTPQSRFCGLSTFHPLLNFVGNFEQLVAHGEALVARAGLQSAGECGGQQPVGASGVVNESLLLSTVFWLMSY